MFLALALIAIAGGALLTYLYDEDAPLAARLAAGACIGFAALGLLGFILASFFGLNAFTLLAAAAVLATSLLILAKPPGRELFSADIRAAVRGVRRAILHPALRTNVYIAFYALVSILLWLVFDRAMFDSPDGIYTGVQNNNGDLPFHLSVITGFSDGANFPPEDPTWAGARFTYPFIADFVAACFVRAGATLRQAMFLENYVLAISFVGLLHRFALKLTRDWVAGLIAPLLVLFNGGFGWWHLFTESNWSEQGVFGVLLSLQQRFTITPDTGYRWGNSLTTLLIPQRSLLLGLPIAIIVFTVWWTVHDSEIPENQAARKNQGNHKKEKQKGRRAGRRTERDGFVGALRRRIPPVQRMAAAGAIAGLLPLVHAHSFAVVMFVGACVALMMGLNQWRAWAAFFVVATLVAVPQMWWSTRGSSVQAGSFFGLHFGWEKGSENFFWFWFKNTGLLVPLIIAALLWRGGKMEGYKFLTPRKLVLFYMPFTLCFIIPNLVKLAPWPWDNIKVIFYWFVASVPLVALLLARLLRGRMVLRFASIGLLLSLTLAGMLDVWSVASRATEFRIFDADGVTFAEFVKNKTRPRATILHAPTHDTPIFLTGRRSVMGYPGHIGSHGIDYAERERDVARIYAGAPDAHALMGKYGIEYVVVGPHEAREMSKLQTPLNAQYFKRYQFVGGTGGYHLYEIAQP